jgi:hypothetical protein
MSAYSIFSSRLFQKNGRLSAMELYLESFYIDNADHKKRKGELA